MTQQLSYTDLQTVFLRTQGDLKRQIRRRVRCAETAADLTQDLFLRLDRLQDRLPGEDHARRYLTRMAANIALDHIRVEANRTRILRIAEPLFETMEQPRFAAAHEAGELVEALMTLLTPRQRHILTLSRLEGQPYNAIASRLNISVSLVEKEVAAAMRILVSGAATKDATPTTQRVPVTPKCGFIRSKSNVQTLAR